MNINPNLTAKIKDDSMHLVNTEGLDASTSSETSKNGSMMGRSVSTLGGSDEKNLKRTLNAECDNVQDIKKMKKSYSNENLEKVYHGKAKSKVFDSEFANLKSNKCKENNGLPESTCLSKKLDECSNYEPANSSVLNSELLRKHTEIKTVLELNPCKLTDQCPAMKILLDESRSALKVSGNMANPCQYLLNMNGRGLVGGSSLNIGSIVNEKTTSLNVHDTTEKAKYLIDDIINKFVESEKTKKGEELLISVQLVGLSRKGDLEQRTVIMHPVNDNVYISFSVLDHDAREKMNIGIPFPLNLSFALNQPFMPVPTNIKDIVSSIFSNEELNTIMISDLLRSVERKLDYPLLKVKREELSTVLEKIFRLGCTQFKNGTKGVHSLSVTPIFHKPCQPDASASSVNNATTSLSNELTVQKGQLSREEMRIARLKKFDYNNK